jgi:hypothetical protein
VTVRPKLPRLLLLLMAGLALPARAGAEAPPLRFRWPIPARATVTERVQRHGQDVTIRYQLSLSPAADREQLTLHIEGTEVMAVKGANLKDPAVRAKVEQAVKVAAIAPSLVISREGQFLDIDRFDRVLAAIAAASPGTAEQKRRVVALMRTPEMKRLLEQRAADFWNVWVGVWANQNLPSGARRQVPRQVALPDGSGFNQLLHLQHHGADGPPGHVRLSFAATLDGAADQQAVRRFIDGVLEQMSAQAGRPLPREVIETIEVTTAGEVITDPETLRPVAARSGRQTTLKVRGEPPRVEQELRRYTFEWHR